MENLQNRKIRLSDHFTHGRLIRFAWPSIVMMMFTTIYGVVDGFFISNYVGKTAFASINLIIPFVQIIGGMGTILGADGGALISRAMGTGNREKVGRYFTMTMIMTLVGGLLFTVIGLIALEPVAYLLGAKDGEMIDNCMAYGGICILFNTAYLAQRILGDYLIVAEKPKFALRIMVAAGFLNIVLDMLFVHPSFLNMGVVGAAIATGICEVFAAGVPLIWFISKRNRTAMRFRRTRIEWNVLRRAGITGSADTISSLSASVVGLLYNIQLMRYYGENGVAAYGVVMYTSFIFTAIFSGYSVGTSPIMGYHYGGENRKEMRNVFQKSFVILATASVIIVLLGTVIARPFSAIFVNYDSELLNLTTQAFIICLIPYLMMWFNAYIASVLSALDKGPLAAALTAFRVIVFPVICVITLPKFFKTYGIWLALSAAEAMSAIVTYLAFLPQKHKFRR